MPSPPRSNTFGSRLLSLAAEPNQQLNCNQTMKINVSMNDNATRAPRLPNERVTTSAKANLSSASPTGAGETPALLYRRFGSAAQRAIKICRETHSVNLPSESGSKLHALQTLARPSLPLPQAHLALAWFYSLQGKKILRLGNKTRAVLKTSKNQPRHKTPEESKERDRTWKTK